MIPSVIPLIGLAVCLAALCLIAFAMFSSILATRSKRWGFIVCVIAATLWAGTKPDLPVWRFQNGVTDNGSSYDVMECYAVARWTASQVFDAYAFKWSYRVKGDEIWIELPDAKVSDRTARASIPVTPGTVVDFMCWAEYVAPIQVVTNGVYHLNGVMRSMDSTGSSSPRYVTPGVRIMADGEVILTPTNRPIGQLQSINSLTERIIEQ